MYWAQRNSMRKRYWVAEGDKEKIASEKCQRVDKIPSTARRIRDRKWNDLFFFTQRMKWICAIYWAAVAMDVANSPLLTYAFLVVGGSLAVYSTNDFYYLIQYIISYALGIIISVKINNRKQIKIGHRPSQFLFHCQTKFFMCSLDCDSICQ